MLIGIEPVLLWKHFQELSKIPRCSKHEEKAAEYVVSVAEQLKLDYTRDSVGNVLVKKPPTLGHEDAPIVVLQSHLDIVCEKNKDVAHDFANDPIELVREGDYLRAKGTTLGADNGIGNCAQLAIMEDQNASHGPLELLFTVDEEAGMTGAYGLGGDALKGRYMINLDTEHINTFYVGCAGGAATQIRLPVTWEKPQGLALLVALKGLKGGHSGVDIRLERGNSLKLLGRILWDAYEEVPFKLASISGGSKHNAIPREAEAVVVLPEEKVEALISYLKESEEALLAEYKNVDPGLVVEVRKVSPPVEAMSLEDSKKILNLISALPSGIMRWSRELEGLVESSVNLPIIQTEDDGIFLLMGARSSSETQLKGLTGRIRAISHLAGANVKVGNSYPGWHPDLDSKILAACKVAHLEQYNREPVVTAIHAGLETGIIGKKYPKMEMISMGPTVAHAHSPDEGVNIPSVKDFYDLLLKVLEKLAQLG